MNYTLYTKPQAQPRARLGKHGVYNSNSIAKKEVVEQLKAQHAREGYLKPLECAVVVILMIGKAMPKSWPKKRLKSSLGMPITSKPDNDNYEKFYFDALNGIACIDDKQVALNSTYKYWSTIDIVEINVLPLHSAVIVRSETNVISIHIQHDEAI